MDGLPLADDGQPERSGMRDNLYRAREDGDMYSSLPGEPRKTSLFLAAQMNPLVTAAILAGIGAAITAFLLPRRSGYGRSGYSRPRMERHVVSPARIMRRCSSRGPATGTTPRPSGPAIWREATPRLAVLSRDIRQPAHRPTVSTKKPTLRGAGFCTRPGRLRHAASPGTPNMV